MTTLTYDLKNQLLTLAETLNAFKSEAVQVKIAEKMLNYMFTEDSQKPADKQSTEEEQNLSSRKAKRLRANQQDAENAVPRERKPTGATKAMHLLLNTDFFDQPQTISAIADRYKEEFNEDFKTSEISGTLLKSVKDNVLKREKNKNNKRYEYVKV